MTGPRVDFLDLAFDRLSLDEAGEWLRTRPADAAFAYVVTPNVDHMVRLGERPPADPVRAAFEGAALRLCDSRVLQKLAALSGVTLTAVPGSDLTARLFKTIAEAGDRIAIVGGDEALIADLRALYPAPTLLHHAPPMGLRDDERAMAAAAAFVADSRARFALLAVGSPQQELLAHRVATEGRAIGTGLCIGASIEFLVGRKARAPLWMQRAGIEWLHRLASEPRRLGRRYLIEGPRIFAMAWRWRRGRR